MPPVPDVRCWGHFISRGIATGISYDDMARNIETASQAPLRRAKTIARTEAHRIYEASSEDARQQAKAAGAKVMKQWDATLDGKTRDNHRQLDGTIVEVDGYFTIDGKKAKYPGAFGDAAEDCNCRCVALTRAKWALNQDELDTLQQRAAFFKLDKTEGLKDFTEKYLKAAKYMEVRQTKRITEKEGLDNDFSVDAKLVNSKAYHDKFEELTEHKAANESIYQEAMCMLEHRDGTNYEDVVLLDARTGQLITGNLNGQEAGKTGLTAEQYQQYQNHEGSVVILHNHPNSSRPSYTDIRTLFGHEKASESIVLCHDGTVHVLSHPNRKIDIDLYWNHAYNKAIGDYFGNKELAILKATDTLYEAGIFKYERR
ncbi:MAG: phage minor head protein [Clostridia bacterium]|nr:phage minor head protein [Clostridia bacterium]